MHHCLIYATNLQHKNLTSNTLCPLGVYLSFLFPFCVHRFHFNIHTLSILYPYSIYALKWEEVGKRKLEKGSWEMEDGRWKSEVRGWEA